MQVSVSILFIGSSLLLKIFYGKNFTPRIYRLCGTENGVLVVNIPSDTFNVYSNVSYVPCLLNSYPSNRFFPFVKAGIFKREQ